MSHLAMPNRRRFLALGGGALLSAPTIARAQSWPSRPVRFIVPSAAGGSPDVVSRILCQFLERRLGQGFVVENRPGAGGNIGIEAIARADADGHVIGYGNVNTLAVNRSLFARLPVDLDRDLVAVAPFITTYNLLLVANDLPVRSVAELIAHARANPGRLTMGSPGVGTTGHLGGELFKVMTRTDIVHAPYRGSPQALQDLMSGRIHVMFDNMSSAGPQARAGTVRALAVSGARRHPLYPDLPTVAEAGVPGYETQAWGGVVAPSATQETVVGRLEAEIASILATDEFKMAFANVGADPFAGTRATFRDFIAAETRKWAEVVRVSGARVD